MNVSLVRMPIFLSSAHYGLEDLRGELAAFLEDLGAAPLLSSEKGFPDHRGIPPYAQCLRVLEGALIVIGIIDKRYGARLADWGPYSQYAGLSPTHAELRHAVAEGKHLLIYIRSEVQGYYDIYRKNTSVFQNLDLPGNLEVGSLEMFSELKQARPAPWIEAFRDIRDIKHSLRSRLVSYLAEALVQKERLAQAGAVTLLDRILEVEKPDIQAMSRVVDMLVSLPEERKKNLRINLEKLYTDEISSISQKVPVDQHAICAAPSPVGKRSVTELEVLRVLFDSHNLYLRRGEIHERLRLEVVPSPVRIGQILANLFEQGLLLRISGRGALAYYALSPRGVEACRQLSLGAAGSDEVNRGHASLSGVVDSDPALGPIRRLIEISLDSSRDPADRRIAVGVLASSAREWGDDIVRLLHEVLLVGGDKERLNIAAFVLSSILQAKQIDLTLGLPGNVLVVDDDLGEMAWCFDLLKNRGYVVVVETSEEGARRRFDAVKNGTESYALAIVDVMLATKELDKIVSSDELNDFFFRDSRSSGLRLFTYARRELMLTAEELPIVCCTQREDAEVRYTAEALKIPLFSKIPQAASESIRAFLEDALPILQENLGEK